LTACRLTPLQVFDGPLRRIAARKRQRIRRALGSPGRLRLTIEVRRLCAVGRLRRGAIVARLHEHEPRPVLWLLQHERLHARRRREQLREPLRRQEDHDHHHEVKDDREQHDHDDGDEVLSVQPHFHVPKNHRANMPLGHLPEASQPMR